MTESVNLKELMQQTKAKLKEEEILKLEAKIRSAIAARDKHLAHVRNLEKELKAASEKLAKSEELLAKIESGDYSALMSVQLEEKK